MAPAPLPAEAAGTDLARLCVAAEAEQAELAGCQVAPRLLARHCSPVPKGMGQSGSSRGPRPPVLKGSPGLVELVVLLDLSGHGAPFERRELVAGNVHSSRYFLNRSLDSFCSCRVFALSFDEEVLLLELPDPAAAVHPDFSLLVTSSLAMTSPVIGSPALATLLVRASQRDGGGSKVASADLAIYPSPALPLPLASSITDASSCLFLDGKPGE